MDNKLTGDTVEVAVGNRVYLIEKGYTGQATEVSAQVIEIREILGRQTYVIETEKGTRKVIGASQISRVEA